MYLEFDHEKGSKRPAVQDLSGHPWFSTLLWSCKLFSVHQASAYFLLAFISLFLFWWGVACNFRPKKKYKTVSIFFYPGKARRHGKSSGLACAPNILQKLIAILLVPKKNKIISDFWYFSWLINCTWTKSCISQTLIKILLVQKLNKLWIFDKTLKYSIVQLPKRETTNWPSERPYFETFITKSTQRGRLVQVLFISTGLFVPLQNIDIANIWFLSKILILPTFCSSPKYWYCQHLFLSKILIWPTFGFSPKYWYCQHFYCVMPQLVVSASNVAETWKWSVREFSVAEIYMFGWSRGMI